MSASITRIATATAARSRYIMNCVISALLRGDAVLLVSLDPGCDPYSVELHGFGGRRHHPDYDKVPADHSGIGARLVYVCWAPLGRTARPIAADYDSLMTHLRLGTAGDSGLIGGLRTPLVVIDGCQHFGEEPVAGHAAEIRQFVSACVADGRRVIVAGEEDWNTDWVNAADHAIGPLAAQIPADDAWQAASQPHSLPTGRC